MDKSLIRERLQKGTITGCGPPVPVLTYEDIEDSPRIVAQMGPEPYIAAMREHPDFNIIIGGRSYDPAPYVAYTAYMSDTQLFDTASPESQRLWGGFTHMGKIMECGG